MSAATELLRKRKAQADDDAVWVFPSTGASGHLTDIKKAWRQVCEKADLKGFRLHDLRHTFASHVVSDTGSLYVAGQLLGHTQAQTTARYAHLLDDAMRKALDQVSDKLTGGRR
jgi:integrase